MQVPEQIFNLIIQLQTTDYRKIKITNKNRMLKKVTPEIRGVTFFIEELFFATSFFLSVAVVYNTHLKKVYRDEQECYLFQQLNYV